MSDRLTLANAIEDAGIERSKAERVASVVVDIVKGTAATKADLDQLRAATKSEFDQLNAKIQAMRSEFQVDLLTVRNELKAGIDKVDAKSDLIEHRLFTRLGGLMIAVGGVLFAALHYWPPHP